MQNSVVQADGMSTRHDEAVIATVRRTGLPNVPVEDVSSRSSSPRLKVTRDKIREQENAVLDVFSQESFFKVILTQPHL